MNNDLISREALKKCARVVFDKDLGRLRVVDVSDIDNAPTVSLQDIYQEGHYDGYLEGYTKAINEVRPQGEWIEGWDGYFETLDCSLCGFVRNERHLKLNYCPNCGAKMKGGAVHD